ncbi:hypothetical protein [Azospirillum sp. TSO22-1]|uniref:hypothetical protein n=1 Tax=Azospirillum sp. TSO22-1 TaxID=716789 RepID=UPI000D6088B2|nr:hypothetical protein [Azospirillum sp. TSO22-1]PWC36944.1 hypothetical protein TSO221_28525 [Azospirillum sp. TSO22-1]
MVAVRTALLLTLLFVAAAARAGERLEWPDGRAYNGALRHGRPDGDGVQVWPDGRHYRGAWRDGVPEGFGTLTLPDGRRYVGRFARGRPTGEGEFLSPMGTRYRARVEPDGSLAPGAMLGTAKPAPKPAPKFKPPAQADTLEAWLRGP